jgi:hypothetical protein
VLHAGFWRGRSTDNAAEGGHLGLAPATNRNESGDIGSPWTSSSGAPGGVRPTRVPKRRADAYPAATPSAAVRDRRRSDLPLGHLPPFTVPAAVDAVLGGATLDRTTMWGGLSGRSRQASGFSSKRRQRQLHETPCPARAQTAVQLPWSSLIPGHRPPATPSCKSRLCAAHCPQVPSGSAAGGSLGSVIEGMGNGVGVPAGAAGWAHDLFWIGSHADGATPIGGSPRSARRG